MDELDRRIINVLQRGFPIEAKPFAVAARTLDTEASVLADRIQRLLADGTLTRFGPLFNAERLGGALSLCALSVPTASLDDVAEVVNSYPEVAHNYQRDHRYNMWFVLATPTAERLEEVIGDIEIRTGLAVLNLPKIEEYFIGLHFEI